MLGASAASSVLSIVAGVWWPDPATRPLSLRRPISGFSTQCLIRPVGRKFIMDHYRAYGGPKPPPIDHQGIESAGESADYRHALEPPLTKSARPVGDTEKVAQEWLRGASGFERRGYCRTRERPFPRNIGHFPQVRAGVPLTRSAESSLPDRMAPQRRFEPTTLRLTPIVLKHSEIADQRWVERGSHRHKRQNSTRAPGQSDLPGWRCSDAAGTPPRTTRSTMTTNKTLPLSHPPSQHTRQPSMRSPNTADLPNRRNRVWTCSSSTRPGVAARAGSGGNARASQVMTIA